MPKEQINYVDLEPRTDEDRGGKGDAAVYVQWLNEQPDQPEDGGDIFFHNGWVQLGLEVDAEYAMMVANSPNGRNELRTMVFSPVLTRRELNKLIKTLKKARDKAYGVEEV